MGTTYNRSYSPVSMSKVEPVSTDAEEIHDLVHVLNESVKRQLEKSDKEYMKLQEQHKKEKGQWNQQLQSME